jgi:hypothetical protein
MRNVAVFSVVVLLSSAAMADPLMGPVRGTAASEVRAGCNPAHGGCCYVFNDSSRTVRATAVLNLGIQDTMTLYAGQSANFPAVAGNLGCLTQAWGIAVDFV